jgi:hypothetical protein
MLNLDVALKALAVAIIFQTLVNAKGFTLLIKEIGALSWRIDRQHQELTKLKEAIEAPPRYQPEII